MKCQKSLIFEHLRKKQSFFQRKAQGISLNVIIIAAIALLVLVILSVVFIGRMGPWAKGVSECENKGGVCAEECGVGDAANYPTPLTDWKCENDPDTAVDESEYTCCVAIS